MHYGFRAELLRDHAVIDVLAARLAREIEDEADEATLATTLHQLVATVADHLATEDAMIYSLAMEADPSMGAHAAEEARSEFDRLKADWCAYLEAWTAEEIAADRAGFIAASREMLPRLRNRVRLETQLLTSMAPTFGDRRP